MRLDEVVQASLATGRTTARNAKMKTLAELFRRLATGGDPGLGSGDPSTVATAAAWLVGELRQGKIGIGYASVWKAIERLPPAIETPSLSLAEVEEALAALAAQSGPGSATRRAAALEALFTRATGAEREFLARLLTGAMRQGALEGVVMGALALAFGAPEAAVRRAVMLAGALPEVAAVLARDGVAGLARYRLELFRPVLPMLADTAESLAEVAAALDAMVVEAKLDGARIQVHRDGDAVRVYTRALHDVTPAVPEVVEAALSLPARRLVLDGEVMAFEAAPAAGPYNDARRPLPFQTTMRRVGRKSGDALAMAQLRAEIPLTPTFFDLLLVDDDDLLAAPLEQRRERLGALVPEAWRVPARVRPDLAGAEAFMAEVLGRGHEGLLLKRLDSAYEAGQRGASWLKLKPAKTLDLVVLAVEQGSGRRSQWLSNIHLGARDPARPGTFVMLGKTFKGMTDELLVWQTRELGQRMTRRDGHVVHVRPELVVEIAYQELEVSPRYPGGLALRFARVKGYRPDKGPEDADTIDTVRAVFARQGGAPRSDDAQAAGAEAGAPPSDSPSDDDLG